MDGFPVTGFSLVHFCVYNCSLLPEFVTQSEAELRCLAITRLPETILRPPMQLTSRASSTRTSTSPSLAKPCHPLMAPKTRLSTLASRFSADKKGLEAHRGCSPCSPWCLCR
eukprot:6208142-Pleurochrysis_carterae.AAC.1